MLAFQTFEGDAFEEGMTGVEQGANQVVVGLEETRIVRETHARGEQAKNLRVRFSFARSREYGTRQLQMVVAVCEIYVCMLEKRRHRQEDIGMIGCVILKLLEH